MSEEFREEPLEEETQENLEEEEEEESIEELEEEDYGLPDDLEEELEEELEEIREDLEDEEEEISEEEKEELEEELIEEEDYLEDIVEELAEVAEDEEDVEVIEKESVDELIEEAVEETVEEVIEDMKEDMVEEETIDEIVEDLHEDELEPYVSSETPEPAELEGPEGEPHTDEEPEKIISYESKPVIEEVPEDYEKEGGDLQLYLTEVDGEIIPYGYDLIKGKLVINETEAMKVKVVYSWFYKLDKSIEEIFGATRLKTEKIEEILSNPIYFGKVFFQGKFVEGNHEPILNERYCGLNDINIAEVEEKFITSLK